MKNNQIIKRQTISQYLTITKKICPLYHWLIILLIVCGYILGLNYWLRSTFWINDNIAIILNAEEGFIVQYVGILYIKLLHFLYANISDSINWHSAIILIAHLISLSLAIDGFRRVFKSNFVFVSVLTFYGVAYSIFIIAVDFTSTSIMLGGNAIFHFLVHYNSRARRTSLFFFTAVLLVAAQQFRMSGLPAIVVFTLPATAYFVYRFFQVNREEKFRMRIKALIILSFIFAIPILLYQTELMYKKFFATEDFRHYYAFNNLRGRYHGFSVIANPLTLALNEWSEKDIVRLKHWMFFDEDIYNTTTLGRLLALSPSALEQLNLESAVSKIYALFSRYTALWLALLSLFLLGFLPDPFSSFQPYLYVKLSVLLALLYIMFISSFFEVILRFPLRLGWPALLVSFSSLASLSVIGAPNIFRNGLTEEKDVISVLSPTQKVKNPRHFFLLKSGSFKWAGIIFMSIILLIASGLHFKDLSAIYRSRLALANRFDNILASLKAMQSDDTILVQPGKGLQVQFFSPFSAIDIPFRAIDVGWNTFSPRFYRQLKNFGVKRGKDIIPKMIDRPNAYILAEDYWIDLLLDYSRQKGFGDICAVVVQPFDKKLKLFRLKRKRQ